MKQKIFFFTIILIVLTNCRGKKIVTEYKEKIVKDSIYITKEKKVIERVIDTFNIESPCDSVTGKLKPFKRTLITPQGKISLTGINNEIKANIDLKGYENTIETKYKLLYDKKVSELNSKEIKYRTPWYHWLIHLLCGLIIFLLLRLR